MHRLAASQWSLRPWQTARACKEARDCLVADNKVLFLPGLRNAWHPSHPPPRTYLLSRPSAYSTGAQIGHELLPGPLGQ